MGLVKLKVVTESQYSVIITCQMFRLNTEERKSEEQSWERQEILETEQVWAVRGGGFIKMFHPHDMIPGQLNDLSAGLRETGDIQLQSSPSNPPWLELAIRFFRDSISFLQQVSLF